MEASGKASQRRQHLRFGEGEVCQQTSRKETPQADVKAREAGDSTLIAADVWCARTMWQKTRLSRERNKSERALCTPKTKEFRFYPIITRSLQNMPVPQSIY